MCFEEVDLFKEESIKEYVEVTQNFTRRLDSLKRDARFLAKFKDEARRGVAEIVERGKREVGISLEQEQEYKIPFPRENVEEWCDDRCPIEEVRAVLAIGHEHGEKASASRFDVPQRKEVSAREAQKQNVAPAREEPKKREFGARHQQQQQQQQRQQQAPKEQFISKRARQEDGRKSSRSPKRQGKGEKKVCNRGDRCWSITTGRHCPFEHPKRDEVRVRSRGAREEPAENFLRVVEMDTAIDQDFREERAAVRFYPRSEAAIKAEAAAMAVASAEAAAAEEAKVKAVVAAWAARVVTPPTAAPPGAAPAGEAEDLLPVQGGMQRPPPDSPTYSPLRPGQGPPAAKEPRYEEEDE